MPPTSQSGPSYGRDNKGTLHPVAFYSLKFQLAEINYEIHDKELLVIVDAFKHWCRYCVGVTNQVQMFSDHHNLEYRIISHKSPPPLSG